MTDADERLTADVARAVSRCVGLTISEGQARGWANDLLNLCGGNHVSGKTDWPAAMEFFGLGVLAKTANPDYDPADPADPRTQVPAAEALYASCRQLVEGNYPDARLPANDYGVGRYRHGVWLARLPTAKLGNLDATRLGVWLIAMGDPTLETALPMLLRAATR